MKPSTAVPIGLRPPGWLAQKHSALLILLGALGSAPAFGQLLLISGTQGLLPNTANQPVTLYVDNQGASAVPVDTLNFVLQVGDGGTAFGGTAAPTITSVDLQSGPLFGGNHNPQVDQGSTPQVAQLYITAASGSVSIPADALHSGHDLTAIANLMISTVGFSTVGQSWNFDLAFSVSGYPPGSSQFVNGGIAPSQSIQAGTLTIVPEPSAACWVAGLLLFVAVASRRLWPSVRSVR
jgi:hypothetical protein